MIWSLIQRRSPKLKRSKPKLKSMSFVTRDHVITLSILNQEVIKILIFSCGSQNPQQALHSNFMFKIFQQQMNWSFQEIAWSTEDLFFHSMGPLMMNLCLTSNLPRKFYPMFLTHLKTIQRVSHSTIMSFHSHSSRTRYFSDIIKFWTSKKKSSRKLMILKN